MIKISTTEMYVNWTLLSVSIVNIKKYHCSYTESVQLQWLKELL